MCIFGGEEEMGFITFFKKEPGAIIGLLFLLSKALSHPLLQSEQHFKFSLTGSQTDFPDFLSNEQIFTCDNIGNIINIQLF